MKRTIAAMVASLAIGSVSLMAQDDPGAPPEDPSSASRLRDPRYDRPPDPGRPPSSIRDDAAESGAPRTFAPAADGQYLDDGVPASGAPDRPQVSSSERPALGIAFLQGPRLRVWDVTPNSPADLAGLRRGDVIVTLNGERFASTDRFLDAVAAADFGYDHEVVFVRDGTRYSGIVRFARWDNVYPADKTVVALRPDLDTDGDGDADVPPAKIVAGVAPAWPAAYWGSAYVGPYFYAPYPGPIYYGPAFAYYGGWGYPYYGWGNSYYGWGYGSAYPYLAAGYGCRTR